MFEKYFVGQRVDRISSKGKGFSIDSRSYYFMERDK
jgi:hypothetical protein